MNKPNFYAIIPANVRYCKKISANSKLLYGEITALCSEKGYCWATNKYFSDLYNVSKSTISRWVSELRDNDFIKVKVTYEKGTRKIEGRYMQICEGGIRKNEYTPIRKNAKDSITEKINTVSKEKIYKKFQTPSVEEIKKYCEDRANGLDPQKIHDHYSATNWYRGKTKIVDWKACVRTWEGNSQNKKQESSQSMPHLQDPKEVSKMLGFED